MILLRLFWEFLKIGTFSVGGGMATLPFLYSLADKTGWYTHQQIADMLAVSESTPGPVGINMATYVGYTVGGAPGSFLATLGAITPGLILVLIIGKIFIKFSENKNVMGAFYGIRPASVGLITAAGILVARLTFFGTEFSGDGGFSGLFSSLRLDAVILAAVLLIATRLIPRVKDFHPVVFVAFSAIVGILFGFGN